MLSLSFRSEWIWACSFHFIGNHMICEYERKFEKNVVDRVEISCIWILHNFTTFWRYFFCCQALAEGLKHNSTLTNLNLQTNNLGPEGAQAWCAVRMMRKPSWGERYCSKGRWRANRRWNCEMSERKTTQRIGAEMCQVPYSDLSEFELVLLFHWRPHDMWVWAEVWVEHGRRRWDCEFQSILDDMTT